MAYEHNCTTGKDKEAVRDFVSDAIDNGWLDEIKGFGPKSFQELNDWLARELAIAGPPSRLPQGGKCDDMYEVMLAEVRMGLKEECVKLFPGMPCGSLLYTYRLSGGLHTYVILTIDYDGICFVNPVCYPDTLQNDVKWFSPRVATHEYFVHPKDAITYRVNLVDENLKPVLKAFADAKRLLADDTDINLLVGNQHTAHGDA